MQHLCHLRLLYRGYRTLHLGHLQHCFCFYTTLQDGAAFCSENMYAHTRRSSSSEWHEWLSGHAPFFHSMSRSHSGQSCSLMMLFVYFACTRSLQILCHVNQLTEQLNVFPTLWPQQTSVPLSGMDLGCCHRED